MSTDLMERANALTLVPEQERETAETQPRKFTETEARSFLAAYTTAGKAPPSHRDLATDGAGTARKWRGFWRAPPRQKPRHDPRHRPAKDRSPRAARSRPIGLWMPSKTARFCSTNNR